MKLQLPSSLVGAFLAVLAMAHGEQSPGTSVLTPDANQLSIAPCTTTVPLGKASLRISGLARQSGGYRGEYQIKVAPLFFAGEKGKISVNVPDEALQKLGRGVPVEFTGKAITNGSGKTRPISARATPSGAAGGSLQLWFTADNTKIVFTTTYRFAETRVAAASKESMVAANR